MSNMPGRLAAAIKRIIQKDGHECVVISYALGETLIRALESGQSFDLIFLDLEMPGANGKEVAAALRKHSRVSKLVFVSSHAKEVYQLFGYGMSGFIPKQLVSESAEFLEHEVRRVVAELLNERENLETFTVIVDKYERTTLRLSVKDIIYFEYIEKNVLLFTSQKQQPHSLGRLSMDGLEKQYLPHGFFRISRPVLLNLHHVKELGVGYVELENKVRLQLSRRRRPAFEERYFALLYGAGSA